MFDRHEFDEALDGLRFAEAKQIAASVDGRLAEELDREIDRRRTQAEARAQQRYQRIIELGGRQRHHDLAEIVHDPSTQPLLGLLPDSTRGRAELHLREVERWEESRRETNARRLNEARKALHGLDLQLARGLLARVDGRFLDEDRRQERDRLLLDISARAMELESLAENARRLVEGSGSERRKRGWWRRRSS